MPKNRVTYFILTIATITLGLLSRHFKTIPLFIGDVLYATMVYFIMRFIFITKAVKLSAVASLIFCFIIEFSQLYQATWINDLRHTLFGKLVLGQGFLWGDLFCYVVGTGIGAGVDQLLINQAQKPIY